MTELTAPRTHLVEALEADLIGPFRRNLEGGMDSVEELKLPPSRWYLTGFLQHLVSRPSVVEMR